MSLTHQAAPTYVWKRPQVSRALELFHEGKDTHQIGLLMGITEAKAARYVWAARCREKGLPADFIDSSGDIKRIAP